MLEEQQDGAYKNTNTQELPVGHLMTSRDVSKLLRCSARHVRRMVSQGRFPKPVKIGRLSRWLPKAIDAWLTRSG